MANTKKAAPKSPEEQQYTLPPARTRERRAQQLVGLAESLVEQRMRDGTASPTEVVAVLKLGTVREQAELARVQAQTDLLKAQKEKAEAETVREDMFADAIAAMTEYRPTID